ncbi:MAG: hypothetical protein V3U75_05980 [Methylococcaceae bacterium]
MEKSMFSAWGIGSFDEHFAGLPKGVFNLLQVCNNETIIASMGHFIQEGIRQDERIVLVGFENPALLAKNFEKYNFFFDKALLSEQLIYLYYKPTFSYSLSFTIDYRDLLKEIRLLANDGVSRVGFLNVDALFNLQSYLLARSSAEKVIASLVDQDILSLGCYQSTDTQEHHNLRTISNILVSSYLEIQPGQTAGYPYDLVWKNCPVVQDLKTIPLALHTGYGFNYLDLRIQKHG